MSKYLLAFVSALLLALSFSGGVALAQPPVQADQVTSFLADKGYAVLAVNHFPDSNGNPRPDAMYVMMDAKSGDLDSQDTVLQAAWAFVAIRKYFPDSTLLISVHKRDPYLIFFATTSDFFDQFIQEKISAQAWWGRVRSEVVIYDTNKQAEVTEKDFTGGNQTTKDFTNTNVNQQKPSCPIGANESAVAIANMYIGQQMRFTIGGGEWGTHDYDVPGDGKRYLIRFPPGTYTYTAFIPGAGTAHGERFAYQAGVCYPLTFKP